MAGYTKNFNLKLPSDIEFYDIEDFNENFEKIDQMAVKKGEGIGELTGGALSDRPEPGIAGRYYFAQDTGEIFLDTGEEWVLAAASQKELAAHKADYASKKFGSRPYTSTSDMIIYLDNTNGNNNNDGLTQQTAIKTFTELQRRLPIFLGHTCTVKIVGKYAASYAGEPIYIDSVYGSGRLVIEGVNMNSNNYMEIQFIVRDITNILIKNLYVITSGPYGIRMNNCQGLVDNVNVVSTGQYGAGFYAERGSVVEIKNSTLSSTSSIMSDSMATILSTNNLGSSTYGLDARLGSTIIKNGTQPTGTTSNERVLTGGLIR